MRPGDIAALWLTLRLASTTALLLLIMGTPLAWWLASTRSRLRPLVEAVVAMPLVLPPTVLGFYLLVLLAPGGPIGRLWASVGGGPLVFSFGGLVIGSLLYSFPFVVQPLASSFEAIDPLALEGAATLGAGPVDRFFTVAVPLARKGFLTALTLSFAHTLGEFGVVLMIGGNIPGRTRVLSIAIYDHVEALDYASAHLLSAILLVVSFVLLVAVAALGRRTTRLRLP
ncbi:MAG TPA: molybdate ABC transporter permease subunit [Thermoanaerobaculia bacterium]|nr:molybdate ABC transporter permease subunit [Thermoanaerobaculia bacterium]